LDRPAGYDPVRSATDLYFRWESAWGGPAILGTEGLAVRVFNTGYALQDVMIRLHGTDARGSTLFTREERVPTLLQGAEAVLEVPSYELAVPAHQVAVSLLSAEFGPDSDRPS
jgi:hypothetical protein